MDLRSLTAQATAAARRGLAQRGIEVHRTQRGMRRTLPAVIAHHRALGLRPATVIDVGVAAGTPELYAGFEEARLLLVEALEEWRPQLEAIAAARPAEIVLAAAGAEPGELEISIHRAPVCSSMLGARRGDAAQPTRTVPVERLDDVVAQLRLPGPYVLKVDVEGGELDVLAGATEVLAQTELVLLEVSLFQFVPGMPLLHDVVAWMHDHGFATADLYNGHNRLLDGALAQIDMAFVAEHGRFRSDHAYATADQADALYRSWGY